MLAGYLKQPKNRCHLPKEENIKHSVTVLLTACISLISFWYLMMLLLSFSFSDLSSSCSFLFSFSFLRMSVSLPRRLPTARTSFLFMISASLLTACRRTQVPFIPVLNSLLFKSCTVVTLHTSVKTDLPEFSASSLTAAVSQTLASFG